jgi:hypothetical protein
MQPHFFLFLTVRSDHLILVSLSREEGLFFSRIIKASHNLLIIFKGEFKILYDSLKNGRVSVMR